MPFLKNKIKSILFKYKGHSLKSPNSEPGMIVYAYNPSTGEVKT